MKHMEKKGLIRGRLLGGGEVGEALHLKQAVPGAAENPRETAAAIGAALGRARIWGRRPQC
jgi:hypothetical protein